MKNYKPILLDAYWPDVEEMVNDAAQKITYRFYNDGNSSDVCRKAIPFERNMLAGVMIGALHEIRWRDDSAQAAIDTAEFIIDTILPGVNGYDSVYLPLTRMLRELDPENKEEFSVG